MRKITTFLRNQEGSTAIEYGLIAAIISVIAVSTISLAGTGMRDMFIMFSTYF